MTNGNGIGKMRLIVEIGGANDINQTIMREKKKRIKLGKPRYEKLFIATQDGKSI